MLGHGIFLLKCRSTMSPHATKKPGLFILACVLPALTIAAASPPPKFASYDWSVNAPHNLRAQPPSNQAVWLFINRLGDPSLDASEIGAGDGKLCWFRFVDLSRSGKLSLVAVYDGGGTADCNDLTVFDKTSAGMEMYDYSGAFAPTDINVVKDINSDGQFELVVFDRLAPLGWGLDWTDEWPSVYACTGNGYTNVSSQYPRYYRTWLVSLKKEIATLERQRESDAQATPEPSEANRFVIQINPWRSGSAPASPRSVHPMQPEAAPSVLPEAETAAQRDAQAAEQLDIDCKHAQAAKIERFLGSKDAGMLDAIRWANSNDPRERKLAAQVFADIGTSGALKYEQTLSHDADTDLAKLASRWVKHWGEDNSYEAPAFDRKLPDN